MIHTILVLNLLDGLLTVFWVETGLAIEANILLRSIVHGNAALFLVLKLSIVPLGLLLMWKKQELRIAFTGLLIIFLTYYSVLFYHLHHADRLITYLVERAV
ncbi:MAG: DUF5658 family protein [Desulfovibrionales bacterium]